MKKIILGLIILIYVNAEAQTPAPVSSFPTVPGTSKGSFLYAIKGGVSMKILGDSIIIDAQRYADSLKAVVVAQAATQAATIAGKQATLVNGTNFSTVNNQSLLTGTNITISAASIKPLYRDLAPALGAATWNYDSSSTAKVITAGTINLSITGAIPIGSTGVLIVTQSAGGGDSLKYNGSLISIAKQANKNSIVGFVKLANTYTFTVDTTNISIAQSGGFDASAQALFAAANTNSTYQNAVNNAIVGLKGITLAAGGTAWSRSVMINGRAGTSLTQQSYNWVDPTKYQYLYNGTFVWNANGTKFDGTNFVNTGITPSTSFTGTTSDVSIINVVGQPTTISGGIIGVIDQTNSITFGEFITPTIFEYALNTSPVDITIASQTGRYITSYLNSTTLNSYKNGSLLDSRAVANNPTFIAYNICEGGYGTASSPIYKSDARIDVTQIINSKLTASEAASIDAVWATYQTALGR